VHALAVTLGLDQDLRLAHDVGLVVGDGIDAPIARGLGDAHFQAHGLEQLADQVLELVQVHLQQVRPGVNPGQRIHRIGETILGLLELDDGFDCLQAAMAGPAPLPTATAKASRTLGSATRAACVPGDVSDAELGTDARRHSVQRTAAICPPRWAEAHRDVSDATKGYVAREYGLSSRYGYEIDHLIPLELGEANSVPNLWPEPYDSAYGATQKDGLEDYPHDQVWRHGLPSATAHHEIAANWYAAWVAAGRPTPQDFGYGSATASGTAPSQAADQPSAQPAAAWCSASAS
jgi:hypothetical protein